jgi:tellurium resistance protein TerZ
MVMRLSKTDGDVEIQAITDLMVGVSWDDGVAMRGAVKGWLNRKKGVNLDLIIVAFQDGEPVRYAGFGNNDPFKDGSVLHSGDAKNGKASGDDETVDIQFLRLDPTLNIDKFVCFVAAFQPGNDFDKAENISFSVYDKSGDGHAEKVATIMPSLRQTGNAHRVCTVERKPEGWVLRVDDERGRIEHGNIPALYQFACR